VTALGEATAADVAAALALIRQDPQLAQAFQALDSLDRIAFIRSCAETEARARIASTAGTR
jgi:hypothetical protein